MFPSPTPPPPFPGCSPSLWEKSGSLGVRLSIYHIVSVLTFSYILHRLPDLVPSKIFLDIRYQWLAPTVLTSSSHFPSLSYYSPLPLWSDRHGFGVLRSPGIPVLWCICYDYILSHDVCLKCVCVGGCLCAYMYVLARESFL